MIDITQVPGIYRNHNARLVYLHLALVAGYHDHDRDIADVSIRSLAQDVGITISATRHALRQLELAQLIKRQGLTFQVRKWVMEQPITTRAKTAKQQQLIDRAAQADREREQRERANAIEQAKREQQWSEGKTSFMLYFEDLQRKAAAGDQEAAAAVKRQQHVYDAHKANLMKERNK